MADTASGARLAHHRAAPPPQNVTHQFDRLLADPRVSFWGGVEVGDGVSVGALRSAFDAVVLAHGADGDAALPLPGAALAGVLTARAFIMWVNGHPDGRAPPVDLARVSSAAVVGAGNVALDCARLLLADPAALAATDVSRRALAELERSGVREVTVVARRGAAAAAFTAKELREVVALPSVSVSVDPPPPLAPTEDDAAELGGARGRRRVYDLLAGVGAARGAAPAAAAATKSLRFQFLRSPLEFTPDVADPSRVGGVTLAVNEAVRGGGATRAVPTGAVDRLNAGLVLQAVGFRTPPLPGAPYDEMRAVVPSGLGGRVGEGADENAAPASSAPLYVTGWARRGPTGVIGTNLVDASDVADAVAADARARVLGAPRAGRTALRAALGASPVVDAAGWRAIDAVEKAHGGAVGAVRVKLETRAALFAAARSRPDSGRA